MRKMYFQSDDIVEVEMNEDGMRNCFYEAKVLLKDPQDDAYLVEFKELLHESGSFQLRQVVNHDYVRPIPLKIVVKEFVPLDQVDVKYEGGWWKGVINRKEGRKYLVTFPDEEDCLVSFNKLRLHQNYDYEIGFSYMKC